MRLTFQILMMYPWCSGLHLELFCALLLYVPVRIHRSLLIIAFLFEILIHLFLVILQKDIFYRQLCDGFMFMLYLKLWLNRTIPRAIQRHQGYNVIVLQGTHVFMLTVILSPHIKRNSLSKHYTVDCEGVCRLTPSSCSSNLRPGLSFITSDTRNSAPHIKAGVCSQLTWSNLFTKAFTRLVTISAFTDLYKRLRNILFLEHDNNPGSSNFL